MTGLVVTGLTCRHDQIIHLMYGTDAQWLRELGGCPRESSVVSRAVTDQYVTVTILTASHHLTYQHVWDEASTVCDLKGRSRRSRGDARLGLLDDNGEVYSLNEYGLSLIHI